MDDSILTSIKKVLGIDENSTDFDLDVMMHINSALSTLNQLGIGPEDGLMILDAEPTWVDFLGPDPRWNLAKNYTYLQVRILFDPPNTAFLTMAYEKQILEMQWRLTVLAENTDIQVTTGFGTSLFSVSPFGN